MFDGVFSELKKARLYAAPREGKKFSLLQARFIFFASLLPVLDY